MKQDPCHLEIDMSIEGMRVKVPKVRRRVLMSREYLVVRHVAGERKVIGRYRTFDLANARCRLEKGTWVEVRLP